MATRPRPVSRMPVKVTRCPDPRRLPSPSQLHQLVGRSRSGCDPGLDSARGVFSSGGSGHLAVVPSSGLAPLARHGVCRVSSWGRRRPTTSAAFHDPRTDPRIPIPADIQPATLRLPTSLVQARTPHCGGRPSADGSEEAERRSPPRITHRSSTLRRDLALTRTGSGPRSLSKSPRSPLPHRRANERWGRRNRVPSLTSPRRRFPVRRFGPRDDALASDRSRTAPLSPPGTPVLTDRTSLRGSVGRGWGVLPNTIQPTAASR